MAYTVTTAILDKFTVAQLLQGIEQDYGLQLVASVQYFKNGSGNWLSSIVINTATNASAAESHNMPPQVTPLLSVEVMPVDKQIKFALMLWEQALDAHMR